MMMFARQPKTTQLQIWTDTRDKLTWAIFGEPGTGKTKIILDTAWWLYERGEIDCLLVVAPNNTHIQWVTDEAPKDIPDRINYLSLVYNSSNANTIKSKLSQEKLFLHDGLIIVAMTYEGIMTINGKIFAEKIKEKRKCLLTLDESTFIASRKSKRGMGLIKFGADVRYKRILTGTPCSESPLQIYNQFIFLDRKFWSRYGLSTYASFQARYEHFKMVPVGGTGHGRMLYRPDHIAWRNLDELRGIINDNVSKIDKTKELGIPKKLLSLHLFDLSSEQTALYDDLKNKLWATLDGAMVSVQYKMTQLIKFQQVTCGYVVTDDGSIVRLGSNPRMDLFRTLIDGVTHQVIIWCRFREDVNILMEYLGDRAYRFDGSVRPKDRVIATRGFAAGDRQYWVANRQSGGFGLNLQTAKTVIHYSSLWSLTYHTQNEDRAHRHGQTGVVCDDSDGVAVLPIWDIIANNTVDEKIGKCLRDKINIRDVLSGNNLMELI